MFGTWMEILKEIPNSVLWLIDDNSSTTSNLRKHAKIANVDLSRIIFTPRSAHSEYKAKLKLADVFLDTFPYNCGSTSNDVLIAKVPLVSMSGRTMVSRMGESILSSISNSELATKSKSEYKKIVISISKKHEFKQLSFQKITASFYSSKIEEYYHRSVSNK
jgi:predicted O-linked N-acetylglucosamine transferase (SPINDLY family)